MRRQCIVSASQVSDFSILANYYQQYLLCPYSFNEPLDQFVKKESIIFHFGKVFIVVKPGVERLLYAVLSALYAVFGEIWYLQYLVSSFTR